MTDNTTIQAETETPASDLPYQINEFGQKSTEVTLITPIRDIEKITLIEPKAAQMKGVSLIGVNDLNVETLMILIPRVSTPALTTADIANMSMVEIMNVGGSLRSFLVQ